MTESPADSGLLWSFGRCTLDGRRLELTVDGEVVAAEARPLELLAFLLYHAGELVTKDELLEAVWPGRIPSESVLTKTVAKLRQLLRDEDQSLIRTVYGQGYRLVAAVSARPLPPQVETAAPGLSAGGSPPLRPNWRLEEKLGNGHRHEVWRAHHDKTGQVRVFKLARDAEGLRALKREITVFRLLQGTPAARRHVLDLLDWNLDEAPYFLESPLVAGGDLARWFECEAAAGREPAPATRLELIAQTAETLAAAHDAGVLHKDVKPGNVLVDTDERGEPFVRLCDFGSGWLTDLARLAQLEITRLGFTQTIAQPEDSSGTPLYLAPELLAGQSPSLRSDIYALGVMLYQTVVGDFRRPLAPGWERDVADPLLCEDIAACADTDPARRIADARVLAQRLRQLDARRDERRRRDAERAQTERLRARLERVRARRPWLAASVALLVLGLCASLVLWRRAERASAHAVREAALARAVNQFLTDDLLANADPLRSGRRDVPVSEVLEHAAAHVGARFSGAPDAEAAVREAIGKAYGGLSDYASGEQQLRRAIALLDGRSGEGEHQTALRIELIWLLLYADRLDAARAEIAPLSGHAPSDIDSRLRLQTAEAWLRFRGGDYDAAITALEALQPQYESAAVAPQRTIEFMERLGDVYQTSGRLEHALALYRDLLKRETALYGQRDARSINAMLGLGTALEFADRNAEALPVLLDADRLARETLGEAHDITLNVGGELAGVYSLLERYDDAETLYLKLIALCERRHGEEHVLTRTMSGNLATLYARTGHQEQALSLYLRLYPIEARINGEAHPDTLLTADNIASSLSSLERWDEAERWQSRTVQLARKAYSPDDFHFAVMQYKLANILAHLGHKAEARSNFDEAITLLQRSLGPQHATTRKAIRLRDVALGEESPERKVPASAH
ncbi:MAG: tetratricopeptide repeat protein [Solimonas sp.]